MKNQKASPEESGEKKPAENNNIQQDTSQTGITAGQQDAAALLKADHRKVEDLFAKFKTAGDHQKQQIVHQICLELIVHTQIEEELFYPECETRGVEEDDVHEAQVEHDGAKVLIANLLRTDHDRDEYYDAKVTVLSEYIKHHVKEEETPLTGLFAKAQKAGVDMAALGPKIEKRKRELMNQLDGEDLPVPQPQSFDIRNIQQSRKTQETETMNRNRDDQGRFSGYDDDRFSPRRAASYERDRDESGRFSGDDERYSNRGGRGGPAGRERDEHGRFVSEEDYNSRRAGGRSDYEGRYGRSRDDDYEYGRSAPSRARYEDDRYSARGRDWDDNDRSRGGWFGDPEGHSDAARRGWDSGHRSQRADDRDDDQYGRGERGGSGPRRDYDDARYGRGGGQGGWFGDPEGHSRAARRGWENR